MDSKIPLEYDSKYIWSEKAISLKVEQYKKQLTRDDFFEVVEHNNKIIGFHILKKVPYPPDIYAAAIFTLWVDPLFRGKKVSKELKLRGENWAKNNECKFILTNVHPSNIHMLSQNKSLGFEIVGYGLRKSI